MEYHETFILYDQESDFHSPYTAHGREPFAFGGLYGTLSKYGDMDITGEGAVEFFTNRRKITARWPTAGAPALMYPTAAGSGAAAAAAAAEGKQDKDVANFNGQM